MIGTANAVSITTATGKFLFCCHHKMGDVLELEMEFPKCSKDASSLAKRVSLLNFEPRSQNFQGLERLCRFNHYCYEEIPFYLKQSTKKRQKDTTLCYNVSEKRTKECSGGSQSCQRLISSSISSTL